MFRKKKGNDKVFKNIKVKKNFIKSLDKLNRKEKLNHQKIGKRKANNNIEKTN